MSEQQRLRVTLDAAKLRTLVTKRTYKNNEGKEVEVQEIIFDLVEMKEDSKKVIFSKDNYEIVKTHFAVKPKPKDDNSDPLFIGGATTTIWKDDEVLEAKIVPENNNEDELPF